MQSCSCKTTCSRKKTARSEGCPCRYADINARHVLVTVVNKIGRPNTTRTVRGICRFAVYFLVFRPFCRFTLVYEGYFVYPGCRGFFSRCFATLLRGFAAQFCLPQREKKLWHPGYRLKGYMYKASIKRLLMHKRNMILDQVLRQGFNCFGPSFDCITHKS